MTIFGFTIFGDPERDHIRHGQRRIGDALHGMADDLDEVRQLNRTAMGLPASANGAGVNLIDAPAGGTAATKKGRAK